MRLKSIARLLVVALCFAACEEKNGPADVVEQPDNVVIPDLPEDPQPENTSFAHRIMLLQHTGTDCPNCPRLMASLKELAEDENYVNKYHHVAAHSYKEVGDNAYSTAADNVSQVFCSGYYPELTFNMTTENTGTTMHVEKIKDKIDALHKSAADVGISAAVQRTGNAIGVNIRIKAAKENQYRIAAWVLEDGIESTQDGATEEWMNTHNNALRAMAGSTINLRIYGDRSVAVNAGETLEKSYIIELEEGWNADNCKVLVIANAADEDGRFDLANCALCKIGEEIAYQYN